MAAMIAAGIGGAVFWPRRDAAPAPRELAQTKRSETETDRAVRPRQNAPPVPPNGGAETAAAPARTTGLAGQLQAALSLPNKPERQQALEDLGAALARHDPARAAEVAKQILAERGESSSEAYAFISGFSSEYAAMDPAAAAAWAEFLPLSLRFGALTYVAQQWAKSDLPAATAWAEKIADASLRVATFRRIAEELDRSAEPKAAAAWAQRLAGSVDAAQHTETIARLWGRADAQGAFQWSAQIDEPARQITAVVAIASAVSEQNAAAAAEWVGKFPAGDARTQAAVITASKWSESDPEAAARWLAALGDAQLLETGIHGVVRRWLEKDRARATSWIQSAPLSQQTKNYLLAGG